MRVAIQRQCDAVTTSLNIVGLNAAVLERIDNGRGDLRTSFRIPSIHGLKVHAVPFLAEGAGSGFAGRNRYSGPGKAASVTVRVAFTGEGTGGHSYPSAPLRRNPSLATLATM